MPGSFRVVSHSLTDVGLVRRRNEDAFLDRPDLGLWAVADGMGGHQAGDYASSAVITALRNLAQGVGLDDRLRLAIEALTAVDAELRARAAALGPEIAIASTVVALFAGGMEAACLWAGDSRCYQWRDGALRQLTVDHSLVQELIDAGVLHPEQAANHPHAHVVTRAVGAGELGFGTVCEALRAGDRFLLCSDGLTNMVGDDEIAHALAGVSPREITERLRDLVLQRGARDNVTIVVVDAQVED
jgi:serine/threonine protein phosphatase PrpC